jgi:integrase
MPSVNLNQKKLESLKAKPERADYWDSGLKGFGVRVTPKGEKVFCIMYRIGGKQRRMTLGEYPVLLLADAHDRAKDALELVRHGIDPVEEQKRREEAEVARRLEGFTFEALAKRFIEEHVKMLRSEYEVNRSFDEYLIPEFGKMKARELKRAAIREYLDNMARIRPVMANRCLAYIRKMYNWALSKDLVEFNPCAGIPRPGKEQQRDRVLSEDEIKAIWKALDKEKPIMAATFRLRLLTAQRGGEVHSMRWSDIDGEWWTIPAEFAKNGLSHRVPLSLQALRVLDQVRKLTEKQDEKAKRKQSEWIFPNPKNRSEHVYEVQKLAQRVRKESKVDYRAHDFRRTAASMMASTGIPRLVISKILNHVEAGITKVYDRHSYDKEKRDALDSWGAKLLRIVANLELVDTLKEQIEK